MGNCHCQKIISVLKEATLCSMYILSIIINQATGKTNVVDADGMKIFNTTTTGVTQCIIKNTTTMTELFDSGKGADFSRDGKYRYRLWRIWDSALPLAMVIGLNPSTANADKDDATINNLRTALSALGFGGFYMMNCWAYITSKPELLMINPMSEEWNNNMISVTASKCAVVIFAWGTFKIVNETGRDKELEEMFPNAKCFGKNKNGTPMHPLALMYNGTVKNPKLEIY